MDYSKSKTVAVFAREFTVPGFGETLPAGEYEIETELVSPPDHMHPESWKASVLVQLHPRVSHPGLARTLTVSLADLDHVRAMDKLTGRALSNFFLEDMLTDPMVRLVMQADGVSDAHLRHLYSGFSTRETDRDAPGPTGAGPWSRDMSSSEAAENEGMPSRPEGAPPSAGDLVAGRE